MIWLSQKCTWKRGKCSAWRWTPKLLSWLKINYRFNDIFCSFRLSLFSFTKESG